MFKECLDVFLEMLKHEDNLILKGYIPADGSYVIVKNDETDTNEGKAATENGVTFDLTITGTQINPAAAQAVTSK